MIDHNEVELSVPSDMEQVEFDHSVPAWLLFGLGGLIAVLGLLLYYSY